MASEKKMTVRPGTQVARVLDMATRAPLLLEKEGVLFRLDIVEREIVEPWKAYSPETAVSGMRAAAGSWADLDTEAIKANIYRAREEGTRPADRP
jgi:hypothetical protein